MCVNPDEPDERIPFRHGGQRLDNRDEHDRLCGRARHDPWRRL